MIWLRLKLDLLPCIAQEVEKVAKDYEDLAAAVRNGDKSAYRNIILLQANIKTRIEEFEKFYDKFYADYRIGYFEKLKLRLRKLLSPLIDVNRMIYQDTQGIRKAEQQQRRATSKGRQQSESPTRNADISAAVTNAPNLPQPTGKPTGSAQQQSHLLNLQQQAQRLYQKKATQSGQNAPLQLQEPSDHSFEIKPARPTTAVANSMQTSQHKQPVTTQERPNTTNALGTGTGRTTQQNGKTLSKSPAPVSKQPIATKSAASKSPAPVARSTTQAALKTMPAKGPQQTSQQIRKTPGAPADKANITNQQQPHPKGQADNNNNNNNKVAGDANGAPPQVDEIVFTIRMTKEEYLKYLQAKSLKNK